MGFDNYFLCLDKYQLYISKLATFLKKIGPISLIEMIFFVDLCYKNGYFSVTKKFQYHNFVYDEDELSDLLGARIIEGCGVCRHGSSFMADLFNKMGYSSAVLTTKGGSELELNNMSLLLKPSNHTVTYISDQNFNLIYNSTTHFDFADSLVILAYAKTDSKIIPKNCLASTIGDYNYYLMFDTNQEYFNTSRMEQVKKWNKTRLSEVSRGELEVALKNAREVYEIQKSEIEKMYSVLYPLMSDIVSLEQSLFPHSDLEAQLSK